MTRTSRLRLPLGLSLGLSLGLGLLILVLGLASLAAGKVWIPVADLLSPADAPRGVGGRQRGRLQELEVAGVNGAEVVEQLGSALRPAGVGVNGGGLAHQPGGGQAHGPHEL